MLRRRCLALARKRAPWPALHRAHRRSARRAQGGTRDPLGPSPQPARDLLPHRVGAGKLLGRRPDARNRRSARCRGGIGRCRRAARPGDEYQAPPALRAKLRVFLGGPIAIRPARSSSDRRNPIPGSRGVRQALRRQRPGTPAHGGRRHRRRAHAAGNPPARFRDCRQAIPALDRNVRLQPHQRRLLQRERLAVESRAARRVGFPRRGDDGLGRGQ